MSLQLQHEAYSLDSMSQQLFFYDDFLGDQIQDEWYTSGNAVVDGVTGGIVRSTTGAVSGNSTALEHASFRTWLVSKSVAMEFRESFTDITWISHYGIIYNDWNNLIDFLFYGAGGTGGVSYLYAETWSGGVSTQLNTGTALDANYHIWRFQASPTVSNHVHFYDNGIELAGSPITTNVPTVYLGTYFRNSTTENAAKHVDLDYVGMRQLI